jgi:hypothetical protein
MENAASQQTDRKLLSYCQVESIGTVRTPMPRGNKGLQALVKRHGFKRSRRSDFGKTFESQAKSLQSRLAGGGCG